MLWAVLNVGSFMLHRMTIIVLQVSMLVILDRCVRLTGLLHIVHYHLADICSSLICTFIVAFHLVFDPTLIYRLLDLHDSLGDVCRVRLLRNILAATDNCKIKLRDLHLVLLMVASVLNLHWEQLVTVEVIRLSYVRLRIRRRQLHDFILLWFFGRFGSWVCLQLLKFQLVLILLLLLALQDLRNLNIFIPLRLSNHLLHLFHLQASLGLIRL